MLNMEEHLSVKELMVPSSSFKTYESEVGKLRRRAFTVSKVAGFWQRTGKEQSSPAPSRSTHNATHTDPLLGQRLSTEDVLFSSVTDLTLRGTCNQVSKPP